MKNIKIEQCTKDVNGFENGWVVIADTERFGRDEIMFEGSYDECWSYLKREAAASGLGKLTVHITGEHYDNVYDNTAITLYANGFIERDWSEIGM